MQVAVPAMARACAHEGLRLPKSRGNRINRVHAVELRKRTGARASGRADPGCDRTNAPRRLRASDVGGRGAGSDERDGDRVAASL